MRERAPQKHIFSGLKIHLHIQSMQFPFITYGMALYRQYNDKILTLRKIYEYASELRKCSHFHILKLLFPSYSVGTSDTLSQKHIFSGLKLHMHAVSFYYLWYGAMYKC